MFRTVCLCICLLGVVYGAGSQSVAAVNPFELSHRLPSGSTAASAVSVNPFDVSEHIAPGASAAMLKADNAPERPSFSLPEGNTMPKSFIFWALAFTFGFLVFSVAANRSAVGKAWRSFLNDHSLNVAQREATGLVGSTPYFLLYVSFLLNAGIFIFLIIRSFTDERFNNIPFFLICMAVAWILFLSKHVILNFVKRVLPFDQEINRYNFLIIAFNCVLGFFLVPFNYLIAFPHEGPYADFIVYWTLGLAAVFYIFRAVRSANIAGKFLTGHLFHFLLYLCVIEIAPVAVLMKLFVKSATL